MHSCELLANPAALPDVQVLNTHKTVKCFMLYRAWVKTLVRFLPSLWFILCRQSPIVHVSEELYIRGVSKTKIKNANTKRTVTVLEGIFLEFLRDPLLI